MKFLYSSVHVSKCGFYRLLPYINLNVNVFVCYDKGNVFFNLFFYNKFTSIVYWKQQRKNLHIFSVV